VLRPIDGKPFEEATEPSTLQLDNRWKWQKIAR
jgi:hypothetical protein